MPIIARETVNPNDGLIAGIFPVTDIVAVTITKLSSAATYKRGSILDLSAGTGGDGNYKIHGTSAGSNETLTPNMILAEDVEVGTAANATAFAYRSGNFNKSHLLYASGGSISAADIEALRDVGILVSDDMKY